MFSFIVSFFVSALLTLLVVRHSKLHGLALDDNFSGVQKVHLHAVARIGGLPIFVAVAVTVMNPDYMSVLWKDPRGHYLIAIAMFMQVTGMLIVRKILKIKI